MSLSMIMVTDNSIIDYTSQRTSLINLMRLLNLNLKVGDKFIESAVFKFCNLSDEQINYINRLNLYDKTYLSYKNNQTGVFSISFTNKCLRIIVNNLK